MRDYFSVCLNIIRSRTYVRSACFTLQKTAGPPLRDEAADFKVDNADCFLFTRYIFALTRSSFTITVFLSKITFDIFLRDFLLRVKNVACRKEWLKVFFESQKFSTHYTNGNLPALSTLKNNKYLT